MCKRLGQGYTAGLDSTAVLEVFNLGGWSRTILLLQCRRSQAFVLRANEKSWRTKLKGFPSRWGATPAAQFPWVLYLSLCRDTTPSLHSGTPGCCVKATLTFRDRLELAPLQMLLSFHALHSLQSISTIVCHRASPVRALQELPSDCLTGIYLWYEVSHWFTGGNHCYSEKFPVKYHYHVLHFYCLKWRTERFYVSPSTFIGEMDLNVLICSSRTKML